MTLRCAMILGDCLEVLPSLGSVAGLAVIDLPYGTTGHAWDTAKQNAQILTSSALAMKEDSRMAVMLPAPAMFSTPIPQRFHMSHDLVLCKARSTSIFSANRRPMKYHENVFVLQRGQPAFYAQREKRNAEAIRSKSGAYKQRSRSNLFNLNHAIACQWGEERYCGSLLIPNKPDDGRGIHPTAKPVDAVLSLVKWYSAAGDHVLDSVSGSGATAVAALLCGRNVTCIEKDESYWDASVERVKKTIADNSLDVDFEARR